MCEEMYLTTVPVGTSLKQRSPFTQRTWLTDHAYCCWGWCVSRLLRSEPLGASSSPDNVLGAQWKLSILIFRKSTCDDFSITVRSTYMEIQRPYPFPTCVYFQIPGSFKIWLFYSLRVYACIKVTLFFSLTPPRSSPFLFPPTFASPDRVCFYLLTTDKVW